MDRASKRSLERTEGLSLVAPSVLKEVEYRRATRRELVVLLRRTQALHEAAQTPDLRMRGRNGPAHRRSRAYDLAEAQMSLVTLFSSAKRCALDDYVANGLDDAL
ncbi:hypothetical protein SPRG_18507, partial [Saprolegnia parasitica CBS 223.65]